nr:MAG TPA: hypothetical protein [Caudoviricetes sp.]
MKLNNLKIGQQNLLSEEAPVLYSSSTHFSIGVLVVAKLSV